MNRRVKLAMVGVLHEQDSREGGQSLEGHEDAVDATRADPQRRAAYRRSAGSPRGEARRRELLERVTDDLAVNGLVDFSLRRAARAAGSTHKVLLYYFDGADDLLTQAIIALRARRIDRALAAATGGPARRPLGEWVRAVWPVLVGEESRVLDQAIGLAMYDPDRYAELGRGASQQYLPTLLAACPEHWSPERKLEIAEMILGTLRGFLVDARTSADTAGIAAGFRALARALDREEAAAE
jgi:DNA-binding transcriptional regulator YbjK